MVTIITTTGPKTNKLTITTIIIHKINRIIVLRIIIMMTHNFKNNKAGSQTITIGKTITTIKEDVLIIATIRIIINNLDLSTT